MSIDETVKKYIRCHELQTACACDGACDGCEFWVSDEFHEAFGMLREHILNNPWMV